MTFTVASGNIKYIRWLVGVIHIIKVKRVGRDDNRNWLRRCGY